MGSKGRIEPEDHDDADRTPDADTLETASQSRKLDPGPDSSVG
jgi:hypothetical protein